MAVGGTGGGHRGTALGGVAVSACHSVALVMAVGINHSVVITAVCEAIYQASKVIDDSAPVHLEVWPPAFLLSREAHWKERLALSTGMFPRGEAGAGVLVISLAYALGGTH